MQEEVAVSSFIDSIEGIKIELPAPYFFGVVYKVLFSDASIFLIDEKQDAVFRFNRNGTFLGKIGNKGEGPGEYLRLSDCFIDEKYVYICDQGVRKIHLYTHDGMYIRAISSSFSLVYDNIEALPNGDFLCHYISKGEDIGRLWIMDSNGQCKKRLLDDDGEYPYSYLQWSTMHHTLSADSLWIHDPIHEILYLYDAKRDTLIAKTALLTDQKRLDDYPGIRLLSMENTIYSSCIYFLDSNPYLFSLWNFNNKRLIYSLYDKRSKKSVLFKKPVMDIPGHAAFPLVVSSNLPNTLVSILTDETPIEEFPEQYRNQVSERMALLYMMRMKTDI
jgi:hypothetical protein